MPLLCHGVLRVRIRHLEHLPVLLGSFIQLRLKVFELHGRDKEPNAAIPIVTCLILVALVVNRCGHNRVHRKDGKLLHSGNVQLTPKYDLGDRVDILSETLVEKQRL